MTQKCVVQGCGKTGIGGFEEWIDASSFQFPDHKIPNGRTVGVRRTKPTCKDRYSGSRVDHSQRKS